MTRYRTRRIVVRRPRRRWAAHIEQFLLTGANYQGAQIQGASIAVVKTLAVTSTDNAIPTPTIVKTSRFKISYSFILDQHASTSKNPYNYIVQIYLVYVPQGWPLDIGATPVNYVNKYSQMANLIASHPEWIIAKRQLGDWNQIPGAQDGVYDSKTNVLSSKLRRNLNSGDQIMMVATVQKAYDLEQAFPVELKFQGQVEYYTTSA